MVATMATVAVDAPSQLRGLLVQLDCTSRGSKRPELERVCRELLALGPHWSKGSRSSEDCRAFERLAQQFPKFTADQQHDIVVAFWPLREDITRRMVNATDGFNTWLDDASQPEKRFLHRLLEIMQSIDGAPHMRHYRQCEDADAKVRFLMAMASAIRAATDEAGVIAGRIRSHPLTAVLIKRLSTMFELQEHGSVLVAWHTGRLERYNMIYWRAAKRAIERLKDDLQVRLVSALRAAAPPINAAAPGGKPRTNIELELRDWPMSGCPLAQTFLDFVRQHAGKLGNLGCAPHRLEDCPPHSLLPNTLRRLLRRLDAFEIAPSEAASAQEKTGCASPGLVRLHFEGVAKLAFKAVGTKPKAAPMQGVPSTGASGTTGASAGTLATTHGPGVSGSTSAASRQRGRPSYVPQAGGTGSGTEITRGGTTGAVDAVGRSRAIATGRTAVASQSASAKAPPKPSAKPKLVRRRIDWGNAIALRRVVRRGVAAADEEWIGAWSQFCRQRNISSELLDDGSQPPKDVLAEFVENHLSMLLKKDWAKELMYKAEGQSDELLAAGDYDAEVAAGGCGSSGAAAKRAATAGAVVKAGGAGGTRPPSNSFAGLAATMTAASSATLGSGDAGSPVAKANRSTVAGGVSSPATGGVGGGTGKRTSATLNGGGVLAGSSTGQCNGGGLARSDAGSSSGSDSSQSRQRRKRRRKEKKKMGMLGYGDYFGHDAISGISPDFMMMNQMMNMSMMMNNPLAIMSMGARILPRMPLISSGSGNKSSRKDEKPTKGARPDDKMRRDVRERDRKDRRNKEAMIDTDDL